MPYAEALTEDVQLHTILEARYNHAALTAAITAEKLRPALSNCPTMLQPLVCACWDDVATSRPTADDLSTQFAALNPVSDDGLQFVWSDATARETEGATALPETAEAWAWLSLLLGTQYAPLLRVSAEATAGNRGADRMEDTCITLAAPGVALAAVFDGHNGEAAAAFCRDYFPAALCNSWPRADMLASSALASAYMALNERFLSSAMADDSGCTALAALCLPDEVIVANAGDCQCWLWRGDALVPLSRQHTANTPEERARVEALGGKVTVAADGNERLQGIIQVTRCIGDRPLRCFGLTAEPEVRTERLGDSDKALVLASDGLWDVLSPERVLHVLVHTAKSPDLVAKRLVAEAIDAKSEDNVTVVVVFLRDLGRTSSDLYRAADVD